MTPKITRKSVEHGDAQTVHYRFPAGQGPLADCALRVSDYHNPDQFGSVAAWSGSRETRAAGCHAGTPAGTAGGSGKSSHRLRPPERRTTTAVGDAQCGACRHLLE